MLTPRKVYRLDVIDDAAPTAAPFDRRGFCQLLGACVSGLALAACTDDGDAIDVGPIGAGGDDVPVDAATATPTDAATTSPDGGGGSTCAASPRDVGAPATFAANTATLFATFFVVRDAGGLYAVSSQCTHRTGVTVAVSSGKFRCPRHGAIFNYDGSIVSGPVSRVLVHYAVCRLPNGNVGVSVAQTVATTVRLVA